MSFITKLKRNADRNLFSTKRRRIYNWTLKMLTSLKTMADELWIFNNLKLNTLIKIHGSITASHHFASSQLQCEMRAERGKESAVQWKCTHSPTCIGSNGILKLQRTWKNRIHLPHFTVEEARYSTRVGCSRTEQVFIGNKIRIQVFWPRTNNQFSSPMIKLPKIIFIIFICVFF